MTTLAPSAKVESERALASLDSVPAALLRPEPHAALFKSITMLAAEKRQHEGSERFCEAVRGLTSASTQTLILRLSMGTDTLLMWAIHLELDRRNVPPCLRWPTNDSTPQHEFVTWLADMLWFTKRNPRHTPRFRGWKGLFDTPPCSAKWHATAARQFAFVSARYSVAHWCTTGLGLSDSQRRDLMTLPTSGMRAERRRLAPQQWTIASERLLSHAMRHRDRSGRHTPENVAARRAALLRTFVLSHRSPTATAENWRLLTGGQLSRQAVSKLIETITDIVVSEHS
ncbi:hypothetical protein [Variovorax sp. AFSI2.2]|uniref:hypothetical protein n=1 Tax=Variovorax sp. AFSI2.2 TaxID=3384160 RepID=UPI003EBE40CF